MSTSAPASSSVVAAGLLGGPSRQERKRLRGGLFHAAVPLVPPAVQLAAPRPGLGQRSRLPAGASPRHIVTRPSDRNPRHRNSAATPPCSPTHVPPGAKT